MKSGNQVFPVRFLLIGTVFDIGHQCYGQYLDSCQNKVSADQYHMTMYVVGSGLELIEVT